MRLWIRQISDARVVRFLLRVCPPRMVIHRTLAPRRGFTLVELMLVVAIVGVLAAMATFGVRRYVAAAKSVEATTNVAAIGKAVGAAATHIVPTPSVTNPAPGLCATSTPVPNAVRSIRGSKYQPSAAPGVDYNAGDERTGWRCLRFAINSPQYYRYRYQTGGAPMDLHERPPAAERLTVRFDPLSP